MHVKLGTGKRALEVGKGKKAIVAHDVFDIPIHLPGHVRANYEGIMKDPVSWAKFHEDNGADAVTLHLISTDPNIKDTSAEGAAETTEKVISEIDIPLIISGSGNPKKDAGILPAAAKAAEGKNCLLSAVGFEMDYASVAKAAIKHGHSVLALIPNDHLRMKEMVKLLLREGMELENIVMDPATGGLGYGLEYTISTMERIREEAEHTELLDLPILAAASNSWSSREAWMKKDEWGPREIRGPLWESITAISSLLAGADLFMMLDANAIGATKLIIDELPPETYGSCTRPKTKKLLDLARLGHADSIEDAYGALLGKKGEIERNVKRVRVGNAKIGGEDVACRHQLKFLNPCLLAVYTGKLMSDEEIEMRMDFAKNFSVERLGKKLSLDGIAVDDSEQEKKLSKKFKWAIVNIEKLKESDDVYYSDERVSVAAPEFREKRVEAAKKGRGKPLVWRCGEGGTRDVLEAAVILNRHASAIILNTRRPEHLLPLLTLRHNLYSDPQENPKVEPGVYEIGEPDENSPLLVTTNFALTYFIVSGDIEKSGVSCRLLVVDTGGLAVATAMATGAFDAKRIKKAIEKSGAERLVSHKTLVLPGLSAGMKKKVENETGWHVLISPADSSRAGEFLKKMKK